MPVTYLFNILIAILLDKRLSAFQVSTSKVHLSKTSKSAFPLYELGVSTFTRFSILSSRFRFLYRDDFFLFFDFPFFFFDFPSSSSEDSPADDESSDDSDDPEESEDSPNSDDSDSSDESEVGCDDVDRDLFLDRLDFFPALDFLEFRPLSSVRFPSSRTSLDFFPPPEPI